jgi:hypothetical protein
MMSSSLLIISLVLIIEGSAFPTRRNQTTRSMSSLEEAGGFFEGDMNLDDGQLRNIFVSAQAGLLDVRRRWNRDPQTGFVTVPFTIRRDAPYCECKNFELKILIEFFSSRIHSTSTTQYNSKCIE